MRGPSEAPISGNVVDAHKDCLRRSKLAALQMLVNECFENHDGSTSGTDGVCILAVKIIDIRKSAFEAVQRM
jgi:hypothetical protein